MDLDALRRIHLCGSHMRPTSRLGKTHIMAAETFCFPAAILDQTDFFAGHDIVWFCDNEAAVSSIIRGAAQPEDISGLAEHRRCDPNGWMFWTKELFSLMSSQEAKMLE